MRFFEKKPFLMIVIGVLGISLSAIFVKYSTAPSPVTAACRLLWTVLLMSPFVWGKSSYRQEILHIPKKEFFICLFSGFFLAVHFVLWFQSLQETSVASSTAIVCTEVIWVALGYKLFMKGNLSKNAVFCIVIALIGSVLIAFSDSSDGKGHLYGDILSLFSAIAVAVYTLLGRAARKSMSTSAYTYLVYVACSFTLLLFTFLGGYGPKDFTFSGILVGFFLALFSTILGHSIFSWCLKYFSPAFISASKLCEPIVAAVFAGFLFHEIPVFLQIAGGILVIISVFLYSMVEKREAERN